MNQADNRNEGIDLIDLIVVTLKKWWLVVLCTGIGIATTYVANQTLVTPIYESTSLIYILGTTETELNSTTTWGDVQVGSALTNDLIHIVNSRSVYDRAIAIAARDGFTFTREEIEEVLTVTIQGDRLLQIQGSSVDSGIAYVITKAVTSAAIQRIAEVTNIDVPSIVDVAELPQEATIDNFNYREGALIGFVIAIAIILGLYIIQRYVKSGLLRHASSQ